MRTAKELLIECVKQLKHIDEIYKFEPLPTTTSLIREVDQVLNLACVGGSSGIVVGSFIKRTKMPRGNGFQKSKYTVGKTYKVEKIKDDYRCMSKAVGLRSDDGVLRWLSYDRVEIEHDLVL